MADNTKERADQFKSLSDRYEATLAQIDSYVPSEELIDQRFDNLVHASCDLERKLAAMRAPDLGAVAFKASAILRSIGTSALEPAYSDEVLVLSLCRDIMELVVPLVPEHARRSVLTATVIPLKVV